MRPGPIVFVIGKKTMLLKGRPIYQENVSIKTILLAIEDIKEKTS